MSQAVILALLTGIPVAITAANLGSLIQWRKMAFFGDTIAHSSLLGIGIALLLNVGIQYGILAVAVVFAIYLSSFNQFKHISADTSLAVGAYLSTAAGSIALFLTKSEVDWEHILFGDIAKLTITKAVITLVASAIIGAVIFKYWRALVLMAVSNETAQVEVKNNHRIELIFMLLICVYVTVSVQTVGVLLLNAIMIVPTAAARPLASSPLAMVAIGTIFSVSSIVLGIAVSFNTDIPMAPICVLIAGLLFIATFTFKKITKP